MESTNSMMMSGKTARDLLNARKDAEREAIKKVRANYIRELRTSMNLSQREFSAIVGISQANVSSLESGRHMASEKVMKRIDSALKQGCFEKPKQKAVSKITRKRNAGPSFISVNKAGIILNKTSMDKLGNSGYVTIYTDKTGGSRMAIKAAKEGDEGARKLAFYSSWKIIGSEYRKAAEMLLGFPVKDKAYRVAGTWIVDGEDEFWVYDMSTATEAPTRGHR